MAARAPGAGVWLHALPLANIGLKLDNASLSVAVALRLGVSSVHPHTCKCGARVLADGHHGLSCVRSAGRQSRHAGVNDLINRALVSAGVQNIREPTGLCGVTDLRPDGVTLIPWSRGKALVWDFTCPDTLAPSHVRHSSINAGAAAKIAERNKSSKYKRLESNFIVIPVVVETLGVWGSFAKDFVCEVGRRIAKCTGEPRSTVFLQQRIAIAVQRGNAASVLGTF